MENIINNRTFIKYLTYYLKLGIYVNKGISKDQEPIMDRCIKLYNKYKTIEMSSNHSEEDITYVRKCQKRLNLILKVDNDCPIDIRKKENQLKMLHFNAHSSLINNNMDDMIKHASASNISILQGIPLTFMLTKGKYQDLLWQCTRALFYITQILISKVTSETNQDYKVILSKQRVFDQAAEKLEDILTKMAQIEEKMNIDKLMAVDVFLNNKLVKNGITKKSVSQASDEVKSIFDKKGINSDGSMGRMIDSISSKLINIDLSQGNILENMYSIATNVANEMQDDLDGNPEKFQSTIGALTEVFKDAMSTSQAEGDNNIPPELANMLNSVMKMSPDNQSNQSNDSEMKEQMNKLIESTGLDSKDFYQSIQDNTGQVNMAKLENILTNKLN